MDPTRPPGTRPRGRRSAPAPMAAPDPGRRLRRLRAPALPDATVELVLRSHTFGSLVVELALAAVAVVVGLDALRHHSVALGVLVLALGLGVGLAAVAAYRRSTRTSPQGLTIQGVVRRTELAWADIDHFELAPHRTGRREQLVAVVHDEPVPFPHPDAKSLALRPHLAREWYASLIERIEARRPGGR